MVKKEQTKDQRIKKEVDRLKKLYQDMPSNVMSKVISLIVNAAFMTITLEDLQKSIIEDGPVSRYQNGENQWGTKKSPEVEIYNTMIKNHMQVMKQLTDLAPIPIKPDGDKKEDEFMKILRRDKDG